MQGSSPLPDGPADSRPRLGHTAIAEPAADKGQCCYWDKPGLTIGGRNMLGVSLSVPPALYLPLCPNESMAQSQAFPCLVKEDVLPWTIQGMSVGGPGQCLGKPRIPGLRSLVLFRLHSLHVKFLPVLPNPAGLTPSRMWASKRPKLLAGSGSSTNHGIPRLRLSEKKFQTQG